ncbi:orotate phosphoribosyltransferase [Buchnera aphidicola str. APS (Acyrthosiphon pisum)]|uniref:Orotate phosphoribosyltransferase n=3 Tax=Buchnera aphidicola TaxID=9 RepID=PYRE_BUCAI|nr:orotate phosphoribosyltransferase [Buchnera aphidicola]B8D880.1 RecName: Full=Orotate phosphoribosyltransferase; Short=OPRT; Short=OPRTase [Buchnera aphidicola str. Tuc7 (Acyrthosiphon pisum)]B8D8C3.1 RecName: Full=Orotate phosphoribosyltransferase; Short=OPRT; Short=OPRTase [Buchnera aphidicola str. 5A (Acyrthosiphon pisum)]P57622.1 RecName: Full=Orotate phosphoribosyltransferase; Short=OPRT; Short=OPRTase [Buchnera aphidicola str. APS (Acyrthosiphon pisum)]pir/A84995/ orotate phosphoribosy
MDWKKEFIDFSFKKKVLKFGVFQLKSGRISPYFFNSGLLSTGIDIIKIGLFYARSIIDSKNKFDVLFGPAYKGIPIAVATSIALKNHYNLNVPYSFNRKEYKEHGEKGDLIGSTIYKKRVIILDDVITSGTAIHHSIKIIEKQEASISSIFVLLDRKEKGIRKLSTINHFRNQKSYKIISIITIDDLIEYVLEDKKLKEHIPQLIKYREKYGI